MTAQSKSIAINGEYQGTQTKCCWIGGARYTRPLDATTEKKFRAFKALGELFVIGFSKDMLPRQFTEHAHFYLLPQLPLPILRYAEIFAIAPLLALWLIWRHGVRVLVAQSPYEGVAAAWAKKIAGLFGQRVVLVVENHVDLENDLFLQRRIRFPKLYRFLMTRAAYFSLSHANLLRAVSNSTQQQLEHWTTGKPVFKFAAWTDMDAFLRVGAETQRQKSQKIIYTGVLIPRKGIHHLVNAFAQISPACPEAKLVIVGREETKSYAARLKAQIRELNLDTKTQFIPEIPQQELAGLMGEACVFVLPSLSEGLGRVALEAMAAGLPVIGSNVGGIPDMIRNGSNGFLIPPGDEEMLAQKLRWCLEYPEDAQKMGRHAHAFAKTFFSTQTYVQGYQEIFESAQNLLNYSKPNLDTPSI
jgi:glycosyltransferase involved in cell wall biosynthesis